MKKLFLFFALFFIYNITFANTYIETKVDGYTFKVIKYAKDSPYYDIKIAVSNSGASLDQIMKDNNAITGVNGVFFCPKDYSYCNNENTTNNERYVAGEKIAKFDSTGNRVVFGWDKNVNTFLYQTDKINPNKEKDIYYGFSNWPMLLKDGVPQTEMYWDLGLIDDKMRINSTRNFICSDKEDKNIYFGMVSSLDIDQLAIALLDFGCYNAINLDAGLSTAFIYNGRYLYGPGRDIIDALILTPKFDVKPLDDKAKSIAITLLKKIPQNNIQEELNYISKITKQLDKYRSSYYAKTAKDLIVTDSDGNTKNNGYTIEMNDQKSVKTIYLINRISFYINEIEDILNKIKNTNTSNELNLKIEKNLYFNFK